MSYPHANPAYFHSSGLHHQQPQQQPQSHSLPQHFQRGGGGYTQQQLQQQQQQQQASYDGQSYNSGAAMNYHHTTGGSANSLAPYQQQQSGSQGFSVFGGDAHSQQQQQQPQHSHHVGNGAAAYNATHGSPPYMPQSNAYPSSGAHSSSIDEHYQHPHHQQQQQFSSYDSGHNVEYSHGPHASHHHYHQSLGGRMGSPGLGSSRDSNSSSLPGGMKPKRRQVKNACINCQKACKKCDEGRPCSRCIKYGLTDSCVDSLRKERKRGIKRGPYKRRATTSSSNAAGSSGTGSSSASGSLMSTSLDSGHHGYHAGHGSDYNGGGGIYRNSTLPSSSSSSYNTHNGGSLFQRDQPRSALGPDVKPNHNSSAWQQQQQQPSADVKGNWTGLSHSSSSASSTDAQSSRLPMLNVQPHGGYTAVDNGGSTGGRVAMSPAAMYGSQSASSTSLSVGQPYRLLPTTTNGPSNLSMSTQSGVPPQFHQRYPSDSGATSLYSSSGATPAGSSTSGSSAHFSSPRTPLTAELTTNGAVGLPSVSDLTSPPMHGSSTGLYLKSPGLTGAGQQSNNLSASYMLSQPQQSTGAPQRQFALQMPPMPRGRGGGMVDMFNGSFRGGAHFKVDSDGATATTGALTTTA